MAREKAPKLYEEQRDEEQVRALNKEEEGPTHEGESPLALNSAEAESASSNAVTAEEKEAQAKATEAQSPVVASQEELIASSEASTSQTAEELVRKEAQESEELKGNVGGKKIPEAQEGRDPDLDKTPIEEESLGLEGGDFLAKRKVTPKDLIMHMNLKQKDFVGGNVKKIKHLAKIFDKGKSTSQDPKLDLSAAIHNNPVFKRELVAQQLLRNLHSKNRKEAANAENMMRKELRLNEDFFEKIKKDRKAFNKDKFVDKIRKVMPKV